MRTDIRVMLVESLLIIIMIIVCFILYELATMNPVFMSLPMCQWICVSVSLFAIHLKFLKTHCCEVPNDLWVKKEDKNSVINIRWMRLSSWQWPRIGRDPTIAKQQIKNNCWIDQHVYVIFCSELKLKESQIAVSRHLGFYPNIRRGGNNARVCVKTTSSVAIIVCLAAVSVNCEGL